MKDGLVANSVTCFYQDSRGYLWIGTADGLSMYDGSIFTNFRTSEGLPTNFIQCIAESPSSPGNIWVGTSHGLSKSKHNFLGSVSGFESLRTGSALDTSLVHGLFEDDRNVLWCATERGVFSWDGNMTTRVRIQGDDQAVQIARTDDGLYWFGVPGKILFHTPQENTWRSLPIPGQTPTFMRSDGTRVWVGTSDGYLILCEADSILARVLVSRAYITSLIVDNGKSIWVATRTGLFKGPAEKLTPGSFVSYSTPNGLKSSFTTDLLIDRERNVWIAQRDKGVSVLSTQEVLEFPIADIPEAYNNSKAACDKAGHFWVASGNGLVEIWQTSGGEWQTWSHTLGVDREGVVHTVVFDSDDRLWLGRKSSILRFSVKRSPDMASTLNLVRTVRVKANIPQDAERNVHFFMVDSKGSLWCSISELGIVYVNPRGPRDSTIVFTPENGLPSDDIRSIYEDKSGNIWIGSFAAGISMTPAGTMAMNQVPITNESLRWIRALSQDSIGALWIGSRYSGIAWQHGGVTRTITTQDGLLSNAVWALTEETHGWVGVGTALGFQRVDARTLKPMKPPGELIGEAVSCAQALSDGRAIIVTSRGLVIYDPTVEEQNTIPPPVHITRVRVNAAEVDATSTSDFPHDKNNWVFDFTGISFRAPDEVRYQVRLLGTTTDWIDPSAQRTASYPALSPGEYTFEVRALNGNGVASEVPGRLAFTIMPPFWKTWWFVAGSALLVVTGAVTVVRLRERRLLEVERMRARIARDLHDEIGSNLTGIAIASSVLNEKHQLEELVREQLSAIGCTATRTSELMRDIVWLINPENDSLDDLILHLKDTASSLLVGIRHTFRSVDRMPERRIDLETKRNLFLAFKEILNNIVRHAHAGTVEIVVEVRSETIRLVVRDDGCGFAPGQVKHGNGLRNMQKRTEAIQADLSIESAAGKGTTVTLSARIT